MEKTREFASDARENTGKDLAPGFEEKVGNIPMESVDDESEAFLKVLEEQEQTRASRVPGVRTVLVVMSAKAMVFDRDSLRQKILLSYPDAAVFFRTTLGKSLGPSSPSKVDLIIDFTGPRQRRKWFLSRKLRGMGRVVVGRNAGLFRKKIYDRVMDEKAEQERLPTSPLEREREVQKRVLALAGVPLSQMGTLPPDRGRTIALTLPPLKKA